MALVPVLSILLSSIFLNKVYFPVGPIKLNSSWFSLLVITKDQCMERVGQPDIWTTGNHGYSV